MRLYDGLTLTQMARKRTPAALALLDRAMADESVPWPVRVRAAEIMIDRGHGKAVSVIDMQVTHTRDATALTRAELEAIAAGQPPRTPITFEGDASDATSTAGHTASNAVEL